MTPRVFRYRRRPLEHAAPHWLLRYWIGARVALRDLEALRDRAAWFYSTRLQPWLAGFAFVLLYLLVASYVSRHDLEVELEHERQISNAASERLRLAAEELDQVRTTGPCQTLFYLVEAKSPREVFAKLTQAAQQVDAERAASWTPQR